MTDFNPRPRKEGDCTAYNTLCCIILFQSTPSQRGRRLKLSCDSIKLSISIHALAKRATTGKHKKPKTSSHFNPRPRKEGDIIPWLSIIKQTYFNPRPRKEGDPEELDFIHIKCDFNPRPRKEGDISRKKLISIILYFNPRPRKEGDSLLSQILFPQQQFQSTPSQRGRHKGGI